MIDQPDTSRESPRGPLHGVRVVELATVIMVPYAGQILGDLGADVIKVEAAGGDHSRIMGGGPHPELSGVALNLHRNKRSVQLDLQAEAGRSALDRILDSTDVVITNFRPRALAKLHLDYESVSAGRPGLVYCEAHGYSVDSGRADEPSYDDIVQAATGLPSLSLSATGSANYAPTIVGDKVSGLTITYAVMAGLLHRANTGRGQRIEIPMFDAGLAFNLVEHLSRAAVAGQPSGYIRVLNPNRRPHRTKDGFVAMLPYSDQSWSDLYHAVGHEHELQDPWFLKRLENPEKVYASLGRILAERTTAEWLSLASKLGIPAGAVPAMDDIVADPQLHNGVLSEVHHPVVGPYRHIAQPARFSVSPAGLHRSAPLLGQHTEEVLRDVGVDAAEIKKLIADGAATNHS